MSYTYTSSIPQYVIRPPCLLTQHAIRLGMKLYRFLMVSCDNLIPFILNILTQFLQCVGVIPVLLDV